MSSAPLSAAPDIPDYELVRAVGRGAYGDVWLARSVTGNYRAIKVIWRNRFVDAEPYEREFSGLCDYARISINERQQLALLHVGRNDTVGFFYYVMELADDIESGSAIDPERYEPLTLTHYRSQARQLPVRQIVAHAVELARALALLHAHGLVHRDIKPSNIILVEGQPKLADIGLVAPTRNANSLVGTEGFMPPEGPGTPAADVYSLGKVLYELAMGRDRHDYPRLAEDLRTRVDRQDLMELNEVIIRACEPIPTLRYPDAEALLKDLLLLQSGRSVRRLRLAERGLARARRVAIILAVVTGIAFAGAWLERQRAEQEAKGRRTAEEERDQLARTTLYSAGLARAQRALETADYGRARELLRELVPTGPGIEDLRGFEWRVLWHEAQGDPAEIIRDSGPAVDRVYFSPDGRRFAVHDASKVATIYDAETRQPERAIPGIYRLGGFSADGEWLLGTTPEFALQAWNVSSGAPLTVSQSVGFNHPVAAVPGPGIRILASSGGNRVPIRVGVWDLSSRREIVSWPVTNAEVPLWEFRVADVFIEGSTCFLLVQHDRGRNAAFQCLVVELESAAAPIPWEVPERRNITSAATHARTILSALQKARSDVAASPGRGPIVQQVDGTSEIGALALSHNRAFMAVGGKQGSLRIVDAKTGEELHLLRGHGGAIVSIAWAPGDAVLLSSDNVGHVRQWRIPPVFEKTTLEGAAVATNGTQRPVFSPDARRVAAGLDRNRIGLFSAEDLQPIGTRESAQTPLGFLQDGSLVGLGSDGFLHRWSEAGFKDPVASAWHDKPVLSASIDSVGRTIAVLSSRQVLLVGESLSSQPTALQLSGASNTNTFVLSPGGDWLAAVVEGVLVRVWHRSGNAPLFAIPVTPPVEELAFSADQRLLAACLSNGDVAVIDVMKQQIECTLHVSSAVASAAFSPDHTRLVCAGRNGLLHIYRVSDWREIVTLVDSESDPETDVSISGVAFSPDGSTLAVLRRDGKLRLWRAP